MTWRAASIAPISPSSSPPIGSTRTKRTRSRTISPTACRRRPTSFEGHSRSRGRSQRKGGSHDDRSPIPPRFCWTAPPERSRPERLHAGPAPRWRCRNLPSPSTSSMSAGRSPWCKSRSRISAPPSPSSSRASPSRKAPAPELPGKLKAQQDAGRVDIDFVLGGLDIVSAGNEQKLWAELLPKYADILPEARGDLPARARSTCRRSARAAPCAWSIILRAR